jgi:hypothetical protein
MTVDTAKAIEATLAGTLKSRGYRKRGRNWFRFSGLDYQVVNLQKSSWGGGDCYLNLGWDPEVGPGDFRSENQCMRSLRAEHLDVIPTIERLRPDGVSRIELPGISLLNSEIGAAMDLHSFSEVLAEVVAVPVADFLDETRSVLDVAPLLSEKPWFATLRLRGELEGHGISLPTSW